MKTQYSRTKRLFLFAAYDKMGHIDDALIYYTHALSAFGDIVLYMDTDATNSELEKLQTNTLYAAATRHGEYDFGSYKRAYLWATKNINLADYDYVYLVNDSVYGPLYPLTRYFDAMENMGHDAFGIVKNPHKQHPHIQSWFIGTKPSVFLSDWFDEFMRSITKLKNKGEITRLYEQGFSKCVLENNMTWDCLYSIPGRGVYNKIKKLYRRGMPFMKKVAFTRNHGALGCQIKYILKHIPTHTKHAILSAAKAQWGDNYINWLLTANPFTIVFRNIKHAFCKIFIEGL
ncbi:MAG: hypothetical protein IJX89_04465 [Alphaproteobacteria bacterium]|nr:hypothetical protein [Alphaproteobacteria bacterium]